MKFYLHIAAGMLAALTFALPAAAEQSGVKPPTVVELFTSQSCYSCPPAEAYLGELAQRDDLIALEHHVDYWDDLVYGSAGHWKDVFSSPEATRRQQLYNQSIDGTGYSYTPQMVVDGRAEAVGSRKRAVGRAIAKARQDGDRLMVAVANRAAGGLTISLDGSIGQAAAVWLVRFRNEQVTRPTGGENQGKQLVNHNIVREMRQVGEWRGQKTVIDVAGYRPEPGYGCAVLVQSARPGPIIGAARCPAPTS